jgi:hypothetical protein
MTLTDIINYSTTNDSPSNPGKSTEALEAWKTWKKPWRGTLHLESLKKLYSPTACGPDAPQK